MRRSSLADSRRKRERRLSLERGSLSEGAAADPADVSALHSVDDPNDSFEARLGERLRAAQEHGVRPLPPPIEQAWSPLVKLGPAAQIEVEDGLVRFLAPFAGQRPNEHWLQAFRRLQRSWPDDLVEPHLDEGRGLHLGPLPVDALDRHVEAAKHAVGEANRIYAEEIEPELRRQREEALHREAEERRVRAQVEARLRSLLG
jgi:hypothetical protein